MLSCMYNEYKIQECQRDKWIVSGKRYEKQEE